MAEAVLKSHTSERQKSHKGGAEGSKRPAILPFEMPQMEMPAAFSELAVKSVDQAKQSCHQMTAATEWMTDVFGETYATAAKNVAEYGTKAAEAAQANANLAFDLTRDLVAAKSFSELVELSTTALRKQSELLSAQTRDFMTLAQKIATDATKPMMTGASKVFETASS